MLILKLREFTSDPQKRKCELKYAAARIKHKGADLSRGLEHTDACPTG